MAAQLSLILPHHFDLGRSETLLLDIALKSEEPIYIMFWVIWQRSYLRLVGSHENVRKYKELIPGPLNHELTQINTRPPRPKVNPPMAHLGIFFYLTWTYLSTISCVKGPFYCPTPTPESRKKPLNSLPTGRIKLAQQASVTSITPLAHRRGSSIK